MMNRRTLSLLLLAGLPMLAASTKPLADGLYTGVSAATGERRGTEVTVHGVPPGHNDKVFLRQHISSAGDLHLFSIRNDNDRYRLWVTVNRTLSTHWAYLHLGGETWSASSTGRDGLQSTVSFDVDRDAADAIRDHFQVARRDRSPLGEGIQAMFSAEDSYTVGEPMPIHLKVDLPTGAPVGWFVGGRQRGPRNNRFSFSVTRDGASLPGIDAPDFGGLGYIHLLEPEGQPVTLQADLAQWAAIDEPGTYQVQCTFKTELSVPHADGFPPWPDHAHHTWDFLVSKELTLEVK